MKRIELSRGKSTLVDDEDFERLSQWKWCVSSEKNLYAVRFEVIGKRKKCIYMHREILDVPIGKYVDHINHDTLDNRRSNLRIATNAQNSSNRKLPTNNTSGFKGVSWSKKYGKWQTVIGHEKKRYWFGFFSTKEEAARKYAEVAKELHGEFSNQTSTYLDTEIANAKV